MGVVERNDIIAAWVGVEGSELVCGECLKDDDEIESILTQEELDESEELYFCDRCPKHKSKIA